jgi:hypothetical protein
MFEVFEDQWNSGLCFFRVFSLESFDAAGGIDEFLLTGKERMALRTDFEVDLRLGGACTERLSAGAFNDGLDVFGMNVGLH